jgi:hypothetical protein
MGTNPTRSFVVGGSMSRKENFFHSFFIDSIYNIMKCNKCNIDMEYYKPSSGDYFICVKCNNVQFPYNIGNTFHIDNEYDNIKK